MNRVRSSCRDQRGVALVTALIMLVVLTGLVLAFLSVSAFEPQISQNMASSAQARMVADAGLEWAFNRLATLPAGQSYDQYWNGVLAAGGTLSGGAMPIPGLTAASGTFTVTVRNDATVADRGITGVTPDPDVAPPRDANGRVIVTSTAAVGGFGGLGAVNKTVLAVVRRTAIPPINAALAFPGRQATVNVRDASFDIQGTDHDMDGAPGPKPAIFGISVSGDPAEAGNEAIVETALQASSRSRVLGRSALTGLPTAGADAVQADSSLTTQQVVDFVSGLKNGADVRLSTGPGNTFGAGDLGATCGASSASSACWGTTSQPKIIYVKGDPTAAYTSVDVSGQSSGTGILVVENGLLEITGNFRWNGPIIVTGTHAGIRFKGGGNQEVYGAVIVNVTSPTSQNLLEGDAAGNPKILYSSQALALVENRLGRRLMTVYSWREQ
jgi:hypothetical protein